MMSAKVQKTTVATDEQKIFRIYIRATLYITVNEQGYVLGPCFEGSLGSVIQISDTGGRHAALKIPRLLADTVRENAWIVKLTQAEVDNVLVVGHAPGLIYADRLDPERLKYLRSGLANDDANPEANLQDKGVILVSFEKANNPRFCNIKFDKVVTVYPPNALGDLTPLVTETLWGRLAASQAKTYGPFARPVFWAINEVGTLAIEPSSVRTTSQSLSSGGTGSSEDKAQMVEAGLLEKTASVLSGGKTWYAALPSLVYDWATGSLQEAIGEGQLRDWHFGSHFVLFDVILQGVCALHGKQMLHADIRPANVLSVCGEGAATLKDPTKYYLSDYGSFGKPDILGFDSGSESGNSMIGPGVGAQRVTPFYSSERRTGTERESADTAIILPVSPPPDAANKESGFFIRLGWRRRLLEPNTNKPKKDVLVTMKKDAERLRSDDAALKSRSADPLRCGDRLRLREYVFHVIKAGQVDDDLVCLVRGVFGQVIHDRLGVYDPVATINEEVLSLSNFVELRQWSAATDLYSVGAICLYTLFSTGVQTHGLPKSKEVSNRSIDALFGDLINVLESVPHFRIFWAQLERFRSEFESYVTAHPKFTEAEIAGYKVNATPTEQSPEGENAAVKRGKNLHDLATDAANLICQSAPHAKLILKQLDMNLAHFVLFMHFIMSCLHRQSHLEDQQESTTSPSGKRPSEQGARLSENGEPSTHLPFCKSRVELPERNGAAERARNRLKQLTEYHAFKALDGFKKKDGDIPDFNPKPNVELLQELTAARAAATDARNELDRARRETNKKITFWKGKIDEKKMYLRISKAKELIEDIEESQKPLSERKRMGGLQKPGRSTELPVSHDASDPDAAASP